MLIWFVVRNVSDVTLSDKVNEPIISPADILERIFKDPGTISAISDSVTSRLTFLKECKLNVPSCSPLESAIERIRKHLRYLYMELDRLEADEQRFEELCKDLGSNPLTGIKKTKPFSFSKSLDDFGSLVASMRLDMEQAKTIADGMPGLPGEWEDTWNDIYEYLGGLGPRIKRKSIWFPTYQGLRDILQPVFEYDQLSKLHIATYKYGRTKGDGHLNVDEPDRNSHPSLTQSRNPASPGRKRPIEYMEDRQG